VALSEEKGASPRTLTAAASPTVCLVSEDEHRAWDIAGVCKELGLNFESTSMAAAAQIAPGKTALLWIASASYPQPTVLPEALITQIGQFLQAGKGVFAEFVANFPDGPQGGTIQKTGVARLFVTDPLDVPNALPRGAILEEHDSICLLLSKGEGLRQVLAFGKVGGVQRVPEGFRVKDSWPGLLWGERERGRFALATTSLSEYRRRQYAPVAHWEQFLRELVLALLPEEDRSLILARYIPMQAHTEPRRWVEPGTEFNVVVETLPGAHVRAAGLEAHPLTGSGGGRYGVEIKAPLAGDLNIPLTISRGLQARRGSMALRIADRKTAYRRALERNIRWFERSGALIKPDGTLGVTEWISGPDLEGTRIAYATEQQFSPERADCLFQSGLAFWLYGKLTGSTRHRGVGVNLLKRIMDFQRLGRGDPGYGLWNTRGRGGEAFQDDVSWATICSLAGYRYTKNKMFLDRGLISAQAELKAFGPDDHLRVPLNARSEGWEDSAHIPMTEKVNEHPHIGGCVLSAWLYTYGMTGQPAYLEQSLPFLRDMVAKFQGLGTYVISKTCEASRFLLPLALACAYSDDPEFRLALKDQADYLRSRMAPCGAIQEAGSNLQASLEGADLGLTHDNNDTISDQLYGTSFAAMNFWIAYKATGDIAYREDFFRVADYLVRIQAETPDPRTDGGWMRGFDYALWEYYGSNADLFWTAYCMETGWSNAIIDIALALYLLDDGFFEPRKR
jgi:hypothetical protein